MSEQAGSSVAVIQERQALLARQHDAVAEADRELADVLASAHAAMRESVRRLDAIAAELDRAVPDQDQLAVDTPMGAREFQTFLVAKQREIVAVVAAAHELDRAKSCNSLLPLIRVVTCLDCVDEGSDAGERARRDDAPIADIPHFVGADAD